MASYTALTSVATGIVTISYTATCVCSMIITFQGLCPDITIEMESLPAQPGSWLAKHTWYSIGIYCS